MHKINSECIETAIQASEKALFTQYGDVLGDLSVTQQWLTYLGVLHKCLIMSNVFTLMISIALRASLENQEFRHIL